MQSSKTEVPDEFTILEIPKLMWAVFEVDGNRSVDIQAVWRGISSFQNHPKVQTKLLYCTKGRGLDFAVDLRHNSKTFKKWVCVELTSENGKQIYIPAGFGHAFLALEDDTHLVMRIDNYFDSALSKTITYDDVELNINFNVSNPILSEKDANAPALRNCDCNL